jgi:hypothetical protein
MRVRSLTLTALTVGIGLLGSGIAAADPMPGMDMPGMSTTAATPPAPLSSAIDRSRQKPVFLEARLAGANEVPVPGKPPVGDPKGSATGIIEVQGDKVTFAFSWKGISAPTLGHIHQGAAGVNGDVKVPLFTTAMPATVTAAAGSTTITDQATADGLRANPAGFYLNLHTAEFPGGAVRGQLAPLRDAADLLRLLQGGGLHAFMNGRQEVPVAGQPAVGDPHANAVSFIRPSGSSVGFAFAWTSLQPTLAHIHKAPFGKNGPVVVPLVASAVPSNIFAIAGTATGVDPALVKDIAQHPLSYYANLHSAQFPGGAVRGQLF